MTGDPFKDWLAENGVEAVELPDPRAVKLAPDTPTGPVPSPVPSAAPDLSHLSEPVVITSLDGWTAQAGKGEKP